MFNLDLVLRVHSQFLTGPDPPALASLLPDIGAESFPPSNVMSSTPRATSGMSNKIHTVRRIS